MIKHMETAVGDLIVKSREAALNAVQTFNNPLTTFKSETFLVLMVIAWTYLLHAYYEKLGVNYRYKSKGNKDTRYWELGKCLRVASCPLDKDTKTNLDFLLGLRNEVAHHLSYTVDSQFSSRYLACCLNYERVLCQLFGRGHSLGNTTAFTLQFRDLMTDESSDETTQPLPSKVTQYIENFDADLSDDELNSPYFSRRFFLVRKVVGKRGQADRVIEFVPSEAEGAKTLNAPGQLVMIKEVERPKYLPGAIVKSMQEKGYQLFRMHHHTSLWKKMDARREATGYGTWVSGHWYWYERWTDVVRDHCLSNAQKYIADRERKLLDRPSVRG